ncbi:DNA mismatch endonuclease Vsr [Chelativorans sp. M5D2P16]|uniref:very short patch repair endonuclease n=1 Tax=Chelativorans sp. M5D2P16 TaxID=3095678 RepID=UPI002ACA055A|nr:DNA mismatch endonuclease Vsr [Chelativorans sp. M5D2P16]MDZ5698646.1 DNA mismatch endonuclease Vsr [Chelativorans sp. M5D2P16]
MNLHLNLERGAMDIVSQEKRSAMMARVRGKDTQPELRVRRVAHALGFRHRLHRRDLPGSPDLVFPRLRKVILVHGCYWHRHRNCRFAYTPKSNTEFWERKFRANQERDRRALSELTELGWDTLVIWECETEDLEHLRERVASHLGGVRDIDYRC